MSCPALYSVIHTKIRVVLHLQSPTYQYHRPLCRLCLSETGLSSEQTHCRPEAFDPVYDNVCPGATGPLDHYRHQTALAMPGNSKLMPKRQRFCCYIIWHWQAHQQLFEYTRLQNLMCVLDMIRRNVQLKFHSKPWLSSLPERVPLLEGPKTINTVHWRLWHIVRRFIYTREKCTSCISSRTRIQDPIHSLVRTSSASLSGTEVCTSKEVTNVGFTRGTLSKESCVR